MRDFAYKFYHSAAWLKCRDAFISYRTAVDGGRCQRCHDRLGYIVHHRTELTPENITDSTVALNWNNLEYVCHECHNMIHDVYQNKNRVLFDENGDVIEKPKKFLGWGSKF